MSMCMDCECKLKQRTVCVTRCVSIIEPSVNCHRLSFPSESGDGPYERWLVFVNRPVVFLQPTSSWYSLLLLCVCVCVCVYV